MDSISFKANLVNNAVIKYRKPNKLYSDLSVSIVRMTNTKSDQNAIRKIATLWRNISGKQEYTFADIMYQRVFNRSSKIIYALTTQSSNYKKLCPEEVLGMVEFNHNKKNCIIDCVQTRPDCINSENKNPYKGIGAAMMLSLINLTDCRKFYLYSKEETMKFYEKLGFKVSNRELSCPLMVYEK
ncbi:MAG: GNAT family N-acetyltransferase [bacterium]|nr:GNAT family N-acetyltransferase [bacterium]